jgi:hypothetical protein
VFVWGFSLSFIEWQELRGNASIDRELGSAAVVTEPVNLVNMFGDLARKSFMRGSGGGRIGMRLRMPFARYFNIRSNLGKQSHF